MALDPKLSELLPDISASLPRLGGSRSITLSFSEAVPTWDETRQGWRILVTVTAAVEMPKEIFVYKRCPTAGDELAYLDEFDHIASAPEMVELPINEPMPPGSFANPWFRTSAIDLLYRRSVLMEKGVQELLNNVVELVKVLNTLDQVNAIGEVTIGG